MSGGLLGGFGGAMAGRLEDGLRDSSSSAREAGHRSRMAEIAADNATDAANIAARNAHIAAENAAVAARNSGLAVEEGREQNQQILDQLAKGVKEYIMPAVTENSAAIAALTDLVKAVTQQNQELLTRLDNIERQQRSKD